MNRLTLTMTILLVVSFYRLNNVPVSSRKYSITCSCYEVLSGENMFINVIKVKCIGFQLTKP